MCYNCPKLYFNNTTVLKQLHDRSIYLSMHLYREACTGYHTWMLIGILKDREKPLQIIKVTGKKHGLEKVCAIEHSILLPTPFS